MHDNNIAMVKKLSWFLLMFYYDQRLLLQSELLKLVMKDTNLLDIQLPWSQLQRLKFIERQLLWGRQLQTRLMVDAYGISRHQAMKDIKLYCQVFPENVKPYSPADMSYRPSHTFNPGLISEDICHVLDAGGFSSIVGAQVESVPVIHRRVIDGVIASVLSSLEIGADIEILYASSSTPSGARRRLRPSALFFTANRLHIRAFCYKKKDHRDFVLSRMLTLPELKKASEAVPEDASFFRELEVKVIPNPALDDIAQKLIAKEYELENERCFIVKECLVNYFLRANSLPSSLSQLRDAETSPWAYPVVAALDGGLTSLFYSEK